MVYKGLGRNWFLKKTWSQKSRDTVPLTFIYFSTCVREDIVELDIVIDNLVISHLSNFSIDKVNAKNTPLQFFLKT